MANFGTSSLMPKMKRPRQKAKAIIRRRKANKAARLARRKQRGK